MDHPLSAANLVGIARQHQQQQQQQNTNNEAIIDQTLLGQPEDYTHQPGLDARKTCIFCQKTFNHPGSLGRHLDLKRGTRIHPAEQVDQVRGHVKRRGDQVEVRARRAARAKQYNSRQDVKERARIRRREKDKMNNAKQKARANFINRIGQPPSLPSNPSFAYCVVYLLPPREWPNDDTPPSAASYAKLKQLLDPSKHPDNSHILMEWTSIIDIAFHHWQLESCHSQSILWTQSLSLAARQALGHLSLYDFGSRDEWLLAEEKRLLTHQESNNDDDDNNTTRSHDDCLDI